MKKLHYILFALILFMAFTTGVEAARCKYNFNGVDVLLSSTDNDNVLDSIDDNGNFVCPYKIAAGNKITLKDGNCPNVTFIDTKQIFSLVPYRMVYKTKTNCINDNPRTGGEEKCTTVSGTIDNSEESDWSILEEEAQFDLTSSDSNSCHYSYDNIELTITKDGNSIKPSAKSQNNSATKFEFRNKNEIKNDMISNGNLTCPKFIYANVLADVRMTTVDFLGVGTEADKDYSTDVEEAHENNWKRDDAISDENWNQPNIGCSDIFSEKPGSVGSILRTILGYIRVIGPILVVLLSAIDFIKAIFGFDEKAMSNAYRKLIIRLIAAIALFLIPTLIDVLLNFINATTCTDYFK